MEEKFAQQLKKGVLDMVVLKLISRKQTYGYELLQELEQQGEGFFSLKKELFIPYCTAWRTADLLRHPGK